MEYCCKVPLAGVNVTEVIATFVPMLHSPALSKSMFALAFVSQAPSIETDLAFVEVKLGTYTSQLEKVLFVSLALLL